MPHQYNALRTKVIRLKNLECGLFAFKMDISGVLFLGCLAQDICVNNFVSLAHHIVVDQFELSQHALIVPFP